MSSAFIPVLTEVKIQKGEEEAERLAKRTLTFILLFVGSVTLLGIIFAPLIVKIIAPGFNEPGQFSNTVLLTRIMFPFLLFVSMAAFMMGALNVKRVFFVPALASAWFNVAVIITILLFTGLFRRPILAVAVGVTIGGFIQFASQVPSYLNQGYSFGIDTGFGDRALKKMGRLILPTTLGLAVAQINIFVSTILASFLAEGSIAYLYYSMRLIQFPVGIFGVAMGMAVLPALSEHAAKGEMKLLSRDFSYSLRLLFFITVPAMIGLISLRIPIVNLLFQRGEFDIAATKGTAYSLIFYSIGIWSIVGVRVVVSAFYSMQDTRTPVKAAMLALLLNIICSLLLMGPMKHGGLALANSISSGFNFIFLFYLLRRRLGSVEGRRMLRSFTKVLAASIIMGFAGWLLLNGSSWEEDGDSLRKSLSLGGTILLCAGLYFLITFMMKSEELKTLYETFRKRQESGG